MNKDELLELEQDIAKAKCIADILFSETAEATDNLYLGKEYHERISNISSILVDYLAAAKEEINRLEMICNG